MTATCADGFRPRDFDPDSYAEGLGLGQTICTEGNRRARQVVEVIDPAARDRRLEELLRQYHSSRANRVLVFALYKKEAARLETALQRRGWKVGLPGWGGNCQHHASCASACWCMRCTKTALQRRGWKVGLPGRGGNC